MKDIFSSASTVYAWFGGQLRHRHVNIPREAYSKGIRRGNKKKGKRGLRTLTYREYWARLWIIQKLVLARRIYFTTGEKSIRWEHLRDVTIDQLELYQRRPLGNNKEFHQTCLH